MLIRRKLGGTGLDVSPIALGGSAFTYVHRAQGWDPSSDDGRRHILATLNACLDRGHQLLRHCIGLWRRVKRNADRRGDGAAPR